MTDKTPLDASRRYTRLDINREIQNARRIGAKVRPEGFSLNRTGEKRASRLTENL